MDDATLAPDTAHSHETDAGPLAPTGAAGLGRTGPRTTAGAVVTAAVPVLAVVVAAAPLVAVPVVGAVVGLLGARAVGDHADEPPAPQQTGPPPRREHTGAPAD